MRKRWLVFLIVLTVLLCGCGQTSQGVQSWLSSFDDVGPGAVAMSPFEVPTMGVRSVLPTDCSQQLSPGVYGCEGLPPGEGVLVMSGQSAPIPLADAPQMLAEMLGTPQAPEPLRTYRGRELTWEWYQTTSMLEGQGLPQPPAGGAYHVDFALAEMEGGVALVAMITVEADRGAHSAFYEALFSHSMYNTVPLPSQQAPEPEGGEND